MKSGCLLSNQLVAAWGTELDSDFPRTSNNGNIDKVPQVEVKEEAVEEPKQPDIQTNDDIPSNKLPTQLVSEISIQESSIESEAPTQQPELSKQSSTRPPRVAKKVETASKKKATKKPEITKPTVAFNFDDDDN